MTKNKLEISKNTLIETNKEYKKSPPVKYIAKNSDRPHAKSMEHSHHNEFN